MQKKIEGVLVAMVTPFDENEELSKSAVHAIVDYLIEQGVHGLFPLGSTGEFFALSLMEKKLLIDLVVEAADGRVLVMPQTGGITTRESIELSRYAERAGADAVSVLTPFFTKPTQEELCQHYEEIAEAVDIPVL